MVESAYGNTVEAVLVLRADGTFSLSAKVEVFGSIEETGSWEIVGSKIVLDYTINGLPTRSQQQGYTLRGDRLTIFNEDGSVEVWERRE